MIQKFKQLASLLIGGILLISVVLFGTSILNNVHNAYLRSLSSWMVKITNKAGTSGATGFVIQGASGNKYIMTNGHVCGLNENGLLNVQYQGETFRVEVYKQYKFNDLCALTAHRPLGSAVRIAHTDILGESTWAIGHPLLEPKSVSLGELSGTVSIEVIVKMNPEKFECAGPTYKLIDTSNTMMALFGINSVCVRELEARASTISILPGNSGSPVVDLFGSVVGVAFAANEYGTRSYIVPLTDLKEFLKEL